MQQHIFFVFLIFSTCTSSIIIHTHTTELHIGNLSYILLLKIQRKNIIYLTLENSIWKLQKLTAQS